MNKPNLLFSSLAIVGLSGIIGIYSFENRFPTCDSYLLNTYLYLALGIALIGAVSSSSPNTLLMSSEAMWLSFIGSLIGVIALGLISNKSIIQSHLLWLFIVLCLGVLIFPIIHLSENSIIYESLLITAIIFKVMTMVAFIGDEFFREYLGIFGTTLLVSLIAIILIELYYIFIASKYPRNIHRTISYFVIFLFSLFLVYDTVSIRQRGESCSKETNPANYPKESLTLLLDVLNIFVRLLSTGR